MKNETHGTATNGQFVQLASAMMISLAEVVKVFPIKTLLELFREGGGLTRLLKSVIYAWVNDKPLMMLETDLKFEHFTTVKIGTKSSQQLCKSLLKVRCKIQESLMQIMQDEFGVYQDYDKQHWDWNLYETSSEVKDLKLTLVRVGDLGFTDYPQRARLSDIYDRARNLGLELCPAEVAPTLLDQHPEIRFDNWSYLYAAMKPVKMPPPRGGTNSQGIFRIIDRKWFSIDETWPETERFSKDFYLIFVYNGNAEEEASA